MALFPDAKDELFQFSIARRLEFRNLENSDFLYAHQEFVRRFMSPYTPYKSIILFHDLGSGKSIACIATAVDHYMHDKKECIIVTKGQSGADSFMAQIMKFKEMYHRPSSSQLCKKKNTWNESIFKMRRYISMSNQVTEMSNSEIKHVYSNKIIVLDEVHNIRFPGNKDLSECVYRSLMKIMENCENTKIIMATATPMTDNANQLEPLLRMCNYFTYKNFNEDNMRGIISYNPYVLNKPITCYKTNEKNIYKKMYASPMIGHQKIYYEQNFDIGVPKDIYRSWTHLSLFCTPNGEYGKIITNSFMRRKSYTAQITPVSSKITKEISYITYSPTRELSNMLSGNNLKQCSCKYSALIDLLETTEGNVFVFVEEVKGSGIILLSAILEKNGYEMYIGEDLDEELRPNPKRFTMCVGSLDICPNIQDRLDGFNSPLNKDGKYVRVLLGSKVIGESITLMNVRHFHCITPHWNNSTINQAVGRVVRNGSHNALDPIKRTVNIYMHTAILEDNLEKSIDVMKLHTCNKKQKSIKEQEERMKEIAVDKYCIVNHDIAPDITEFKLFCAVYIWHHIDNILSYLQLALRSPSAPNVCYDITKISNDFDINIEILSQALCIIIRNNMPFDSKYGRSYLRAYRNQVFLVNDCSLPYVMFPPRNIKYNFRISNIDSSFITNTKAPKIENKSSEIDIELYKSKISIKVFRYMPVCKKILYLEKQIELSYNKITAKFDYNLPAFLSTMFAVIDNIPCHLLYYKNIESSYITSKVVPRKPCKKTRIFVEEWKYANEERHYLDIYENIFNNFIYKFEQSLDTRYQIYGILSTIDGKMRIRKRNDMDMTITDNRNRKRGKSISSLKYSELLNIIQQLEISGEYTLRIDMIHEIDKFLIDKELFYVL